MCFCNMLSKLSPTWVRCWFRLVLLDQDWSQTLRAMEEQGLAASSFVLSCATSGRSSVTQLGLLFQDMSKKEVPTKPSLVPSQQYQTLFLLCTTSFHIRLCNTHLHAHWVRVAGQQRSVGSVVSTRSILHGLSCVSPARGSRAEIFHEGTSLDKRPGRRQLALGDVIHLEFLNLVACTMPFPLTVGS